MPDATAFGEAIGLILFFVLVWAVYTIQERIKRLYEVDEYEGIAVGDRVKVVAYRYDEEDGPSLAGKLYLPEDVGDGSIIGQEGTVQQCWNGGPYHYSVYLDNDRLLDEEADSEPGSETFMSFNPGEIEKIGEPMDNVIRLENGYTTE